MFILGSKRVLYSRSEWYRIQYQDPGRQQTPGCTALYCTLAPTLGPLGTAASMLAAAAATAATAAATAAALLAAVRREKTSVASSSVASIEARGWVSE